MQIDQKGFEAILADYIELKKDRNNLQSRLTASEAMCEKLAEALRAYLDGGEIDSTKLMYRALTTYEQHKRISDMEEKIICENYTCENMLKVFGFNQEVKGHISYLDDGRIVFIGKHPEHKQWFLAFENEDGIQTRLGLSYEAMALLIQLYNKPPSGTDTFPLKVQTAWKVTVKTDLDEPTNNAKKD